MTKTAVYTGTDKTGGFRDNSELTEVTFAQGVTSIVDETFYGCSSLTVITIPDGVTTIGKGLQRMLLPHGHHHPRRSDDD
jgi:hypothetical protein